MTALTRLLEAGRAAHPQLMIDTCIIEHSTVGTFNSTTGNYPLTWTQIYAGACRIKGPEAGSTAISTGVAQVDAGEAEQTTTRQTLVLPYSATADVAIGDRVTVTRASRTDAVFLVVGTVDSTTMTARGYVIERVSASGGGVAGHPGGDLVAIDGGGA